MKLTHRLASATAAAATAVLVLSGAAAGAGSAMAQTAPAGQAINTDVRPVVDGDPQWRGIVNGPDYQDDDRIEEVTIHSPSMNRDIPLVLVKAAEPNAPVLYLLNGGGGGEQSSTDWVTQTDVLDFYRDKGVNVVIPMAGMFSYYTDWVQEGPAHLGGPQKWDTFLTQELPAPIEGYLGTTDPKRAIAGMSMSATSSLVLAQQHPELYNAVGSFSGCAATSTQVGWLSASLTLDRGGATPEMIWGPQGSEANLRGDALFNSEKLRGKEIYVSNGSGISGAAESPQNLINRGVEPSTAVANTAPGIITGGLIEGATNICTHQLKSRLDSEGIPAHFEFRNVGVHTWTYWQQDLYDSWPVLARGLGL